MSSTIETLGHIPSRRFGVTVFAAANRAWHRFLAYRAEQATSRQLSRKEPRLLRDMGFDPSSIRAAVRGSWDEIEPGRFHAE